MKPETGLLIVRQTFLDRATETLAEAARSSASTARTSRAPLTPALLDEGLRSAGTLVAGASLLFAKWARDFQKHTNELPHFDQATSNAPAAIRTSPTTTATGSSGPTRRS